MEELSRNQKVENENVEKIQKVKLRNNMVEEEKILGMKDNSKKGVKRIKERGVTLIALVITIALNCLRSGRKKESIA